MAPSDPKFYPNFKKLFSFFFSLSVKVTIGCMLLTSPILVYYYNKLTLNQFFYIIVFTFEIHIALLLTMILLFSISSFLLVATTDFSKNSKQKFVKNYHSDNCDK